MVERLNQLAQWAGSRTDLFPPLLCEKLGRLHSSGKPHHFKHTKRVIESVFGKDFDEIFEHFDHEPIGVGAIAQVCCLFPITRIHALNGGSIFRCTGRL
jgi:predicted unusual protein kinase regulating ubiquinone biosynthesis (AarF/ABC1/UbiB family)